MMRNVRRGGAQVAGQCIDHQVIKYELLAYPSMQGLGPPESGRLQKICILVESGSTT